MTADVVGPSRARGQRLLLLQQLLKAELISHRRPIDGRLEGDPETSL